ncbi:PhzF family phenazine biosynthesis protein [Conexibacter sp. SYSU D00693]|uniref:PhzF family phenazine biosynthesis protein n=1 Tax=Conexibacter sp. SYSU D00693 TaxID=2812560 RepID=UPI00196BB2FF|nr:PhzF family phenazine biosynthesis protein [Conexibacter sp. SYSU D00693]
MARARPFQQVDVFGAGPLLGNPVAVVLDGAGLDDEELQRVARWTNLSETTFVLPPTDPEAADLRVRIFTPSDELPFAGHPTLGTCHAWLSHGGRPRREGVVVQECGVGLVEVRRDGDRLAFAAPPLVREGAVDDATAGAVAQALRIDRSAIRDLAWCDNGPGWIGVLLDSAEAVLALRPRSSGLFVAAIGPRPPGGPAAFEVRAFFEVAGAVVEDPVTGSANASLAQWLLATGRAQAPYVARQGTAIHRAGDVHVAQDDAGAVWVGGATATVVAGHVTL